jgi:alpha-1,3-glucan synthase
MPWASDGYSPLDLTLLDAHLGTIADWRAFTDAAHSRGMYIVMENTMATFVPPENFLHCPRVD